MAGIMRLQHILEEIRDSLKHPVYTLMSHSFGIYPVMGIKLSTCGENSTGYESASQAEALVEIWNEDNSKKISSTNAYGKQAPAENITRPRYTKRGQNTTAVRRAQASGSVHAHHKEARESKER